MGKISIFVNYEKDSRCAFSVVGDSRGGVLRGTECVQGARGACVGGVRDEGVGGEGRV